MPKAKSKQSAKAVEVESTDYNTKFQFYEKLRKKFASKEPKDVNKNSLSDYLFLLPDLFVLTLRLSVDPRVSKNLKIIAAALLAYVIMPFDFIPDFVPVIGFLDDLVLIALGLSKIFKDIPEEVILSNWSGTQDVLKEVQSIVRIADVTFSKKTYYKIKEFLINAKKGK